MPSNSFISSFEQKLSTLVDDLARAKSLGSIEWSALAPAVILVAIGIALLCIRNRKEGRYKVLAIVLGLGLIARAALFYTPLAWVVFFKLYEPEQIGFKEKSILAYNIEQYFRKDVPIRYLAIGSSQVRLFKDYSNSHPEFALNSFAGTSPIEYFLFSSIVDRKKPENVILYLSEFDLAREPTVSALMLDPVSFGKMKWLYDGLTLFFDDKTAFSAVKQLAMGEIFPEFKYGFMFRTVTNPVLEVTNKNELNVQPGENWAEVQAKSLQEKLDPAYIERNVALLEDFLKYCSARNVRVYIFEGQYHPAAYNDTVIHTSQIARTSLEQLAARNGAVFIGKDKQPALTESDFVDGYHIGGTDNAYRFGENLMAAIKN